MTRIFIKTHMKEGISFAQSLKIAPSDRTYEEFEKSMGGYDIKGLASVDDILKKYYYGVEFGRLERVYGFILACNLDKGGRTLSIGSGNAGIETKLIKDGYNIILSDIKKSDYIEHILKLTGKKEFIELDITGDVGQLEHGFDAVMPINLIYLFNEIELQEFFTNVRRLLKDGGLLVLDSSNSAPNIFSVLFKEYIPFIEGYFRAIYSRFKGKRIWPQRQKHGYMHSDRDIIDSAKKAGFTLLKREDCCYETDLIRSFTLEKLYKLFPSILDIYRKAGKIMGIPHCRMFLFCSGE